MAFTAEGRKRAVVAGRGRNGKTEEKCRFPVPSYRAGFFIKGGEHE
nr:MAG TPA: hypothetical protein [Caudoviricetes sp.]